MFRKNSEIPFSLLCPRALLSSVNRPWTAQRSMACHNGPSPGSVDPDIDKAMKVSRETSTPGSSSSCLGG